MHASDSLDHDKEFSSLDDPYPLWVAVTSPILPVSDSSVFPWLAAISGVLVAILPLGRRALDIFSRTRLLETLRSQSAKSRFENYFKQLDQIIIASAILNATAQILFVLSTSLWIRASHPPTTPGDGIAHILMCAIPIIVYLVAFGMVVPRALIHRGGAETLVHILLAAAYYLSWAFTPIIWPLIHLQEFLEKLSSKGNGSDPNHITEGLLSVVEEGEREGVIDQEEADMIESIMEFRDVEVCEIMTPRTDMIALDVETPIHEALELAQKGPSRIPVYEGNQDRVIGIFYFKDIISFLARNKSLPTLREASRPTYFIPESKKIGQLLKDFRREKVHMAIILDEYGGTAGLITIEDILEELVGDIIDEFDHEETDWAKPLGDGSAEVDARLRIDDLNSLLGTDIPQSNDFDTVGGFVFATLGSIPKTGESLVVKDTLELKILSADDRRIHRVFVRVLENRP